MKAFDLCVGIALAALSVACGEPEKRVANPTRPFEAPSEAVEGPTEPVHDVQTPLGSCRFRADAAHTSLVCTGAKDVSTWAYETVADGRDAALVADDERLYVAWFWPRAVGGEVIAYELQSGVIAWRTPLLGLGRTGLGRYPNGAHLGLTGSAIEARIWESGGHYAQSFELTTGRAPGATALPPTEPAHPGAAEGVAFSFAGQSPRRHRSASVAATGGVACMFVPDQDASRTRVACSVDGTRLWGVDLADRFVPGGALATDGERLFVAEYCAISSGATVSAYDLARGRFLWKTTLHALGPVAHSEYYSDVDLRVDGAGGKARVVVSGWEAYGRYVEVLDSATGEDLGNRKEPE